jgi:hypothetical protein
MKKAAGNRGIDPVSWRLCLPPAQRGGAAGTGDGPAEARLTLRRIFQQVILLQRSMTILHDRCRPMQKVIAKHSH